MNDSIQKQEYEVFNLIEDDIDQYIKKSVRTIRDLEKETDLRDISGYDEAENYRFNKKRLATNIDKLEKSQGIYNEPYFIHIQYDLIDPKTGKKEPKEIYIGKESYEIKNRKIPFVDEKRKWIYGWTLSDADFYFAKQDKIYENGGRFSFEGKQYQMKEIRKFNVDNGTLLNCFVTFQDGKPVLKAGELDPYLQKVLERKKDEVELTDIISTLQSSQNAIIRLPENQNFILQGCAGSGKTMIMLHRIAFLQKTEKLGEFNRIMILTPNSEFNNHIASVQKTLGLETEQIEVEAIEDFYLSLAAAYNQNLEQDPEFESKYSLKFSNDDEEVLPEGFLKQVYSADFLEETRLFSDLFSQTVRENLPDIIEIYSNPEREGQESLFELLNKRTAFLAEHRKEIETLKKVETNLERAVKRKQSFDDRYLSMKESAKKISEVFQRLINQINSVNGKSEAKAATLELTKELNAEKVKVQKRLTAKVNAVQSIKERMIEDLNPEKGEDRKIELLEAWNRFETEFNTFIQKTAGLDDSEYEAAENEFYKSLENSLFASEAKKILDLKWEIFFLENSGQRLDEILSDQKGGFLQKKKIAENKIYHINDELIRELDKLQEGKYTKSVYRGQGWLLGATRIPALVVKREAIKDFDIINDPKFSAMIRSLQQQHKDLSELLFHKNYCVKQLEAEGKAFQKFAGWDNYFIEVIASRLPEEYRQTTVVNDIHYRYNLYLLLLAQSLYFPSLESESLLINIDEAQDLSEGEYELLEDLYHDQAVLNLYGDTMQNIFYGRGFSSWNDLGTDRQFNVKTLDDNYRNPIEITKYCNRRFNLRVGAIGTQSQISSVVKEVACIEQGYEWLKDTIHNHKGEKTAVIYKNEDSGNEIISLLKAQFGDNLLEQFPLLSFHSIQKAKGMEFQNVLVLTDNMSEQEQYVAMTRALKRLVICDQKFSDERYAVMDNVIWPSLTEEFFKKDMADMTEARDFSFLQSALGSDNEKRKSILENTASSENVGVIDEEQIDSLLDNLEKLDSETEIQTKAETVHLKPVSVINETNIQDQLYGEEPEQKETESVNHNRDIPQPEFITGDIEVEEADNESETESDLSDKASLNLPEANDNPVMEARAGEPSSESYGIQISQPIVTASHSLKEEYKKESLPKDENQSSELIASADSEINLNKNDLLSSLKPSEDLTALIQAAIEDVIDKAITRTLAQIAEENKKQNLKNLALFEEAFKSLSRVNQTVSEELETIQKIFDDLKNRIGKES